MDGSLGSAKASHLFDIMLSTIHTISSLPWSMESITHGASSIIYRTSDPAIVKQPFYGYQADLELEKRIYEQLGPPIHELQDTSNLVGTGSRLEYYPRRCIDQARLALGPKLPYLIWTEQIVEVLYFHPQPGSCPLRSPACKYSCY